MFQPVGYYASANNQAAGVVADIPAIVDGAFSIRNNHFIFTEPYEIPLAGAVGASLTAAQIDSPAIDAFNPIQVYPVSSALKNAANPNLADYRAAPIPVPMNEEIQMKIAGGAGGAEPDLGCLFLRANGPGAINFDIPKPTLDRPRFLALFTSTITFTAGAWSSFAAITFTNGLRGGGYQCNGCYLVAANGFLFRLNFVKMPMYQSRKLFPGWLCDQTYGNQVQRFGPSCMGGWGRFNNFELPQIQVLANTTTGSATYTGYMDLSYLGPTGPDAQP